MLQAGPEDHGAWSCVLTSDPDLGRGAGLTWVHLGVVTTPKVTIRLEDAGDREGSETHLTSGYQTVSRMKLKLNHNYTFICHVQRCFPRPDHHWKINHNFSVVSNHVNNHVNQIDLPVNISKEEYFYNTKSKTRWVKRNDFFCY